HLLSEYSYSLSETFSKFYSMHHVLNAEGGARGARLALVKSFEQVLGLSLSLCGVPLPGRM
ncbi:MAG TPA: DALR anticodon-binding domain-containing protein, partial [Candidatus Bilamarchaeaceae archaeon]|nr:DALR anticodon-binding domain-containing protein [Candidatus Bilamarchaeaceae archaeon]